jgi:hypothetical protein
MSLLSTVQAEEIAVANASFETVVGDPLGPGGWTNDLPGWSGPTNAGDSFIEYIDAFSADGTNHLGMAAGAEVSQDLGVGLMPNMTYTLSVAVGRRNASFTVDGNDSRFGLYLGGDAADGGSMLAEGSYSAFPLTDLTFVDQSVSFTTGDSVAAGNLFISLRSAGPDRAHFDDVRLSVVPEPATMGMVLVGLLGLAATRRRR